MLWLLSKSKFYHFDGFFDQKASLSYLLMCLFRWKALAKQFENYLNMFWNTKMHFLYIGDNWSKPYVSHDTTSDNVECWTVYFANVSCLKHLRWCTHGYLCFCSDLHSFSLFDQHTSRALPSVRSLSFSIAFNVCT